MRMASASTMHPRTTPHNGRSPPPPPPPGPGGSSSGPHAKKPPPPPAPPSSKPKTTTMTSPPKRPRPPPPPKSSPPGPPAKKPAVAPATATKPTPASLPRRVVAIRAPTEMRDVMSFDRMHQVGQGTYGSVFVAKDVASKEIVALKRINTEQEANGFPITALREVKILMALSHPNIVTLREIVTSKENTGGGAIPKDVYMVLDYAEYDLTGILESKEIRFGQDHVKSWSHQLLRGIHYMHTNKVVHRDLKCSNLLVNKRGELKIADWGLARSWNEEMKQLTTRVITLWYRPPELLLGAQTYSTKIDMWSAGCIIIEMFRRKGFLMGNTEAVQLDLIFRTCGHPTVEDWPDIDQTCKLWKKFKPEADKPRFPNRLEVALTTNLPNPSWMTPEAVAMITGLLQMNPSKRFSALDALTTTDYFFPEASVKAPSELSMDFALNSVHEFECRRNATAKANNGRQ